MAITIVNTLVFREILSNPLWIIAVCIMLKYCLVILLPRQRHFENPRYHKLLLGPLILYLALYAPLRSISVTNSTNVRRNLRKRPTLSNPNYGTKDHQQVESDSRMLIQDVPGWHVQGLFFPPRWHAVPDYIVGFFSLPSPCLYISFLLGLTYAYFHIYYTYYA